MVLRAGIGSELSRKSPAPTRFWVCHERSSSVSRNTLSVGPAVPELKNVQPTGYRGAMMGRRNGL